MPKTMPQRGVLYDFSHFESTNQLTNLNGWTLDTEIHHKSRSKASLSESDESHMAQSIFSPMAGQSASHACGRDQALWAGASEMRMRGKLQ